MSPLSLIILILFWWKSRAAAFYILDGWINWGYGKLLQKIILFILWPMDKGQTDTVDIMMMNKMNKKHHNSVATDWEHWYLLTIRLVDWSEIQMMNAIIWLSMCFFLVCVSNDDALFGTRDLINRSPWERKNNRQTTFAKQRRHFIIFHYNEFAAASTVHWKAYLCTVNRKWIGKSYSKDYRWNIKKIWIKSHYIQFQWQNRTIFTVIIVNVIIFGIIPVDNSSTFLWFHLK